MANAMPISALMMQAVRNGAAVGTVTYTPALKFNDARNSQYLPLLLRR